jgi:sugar O-acyltransferase (sialic acid O-acetyltransferase NeuD family)
MAASPPMAGRLPQDCERILIVGAGGFGREVLQWARDAWPECHDKIAGFLSADPRRLDGTSCQLPILADPVAFTPGKGDYLLLAIGIHGIRRTVTEDLLGRGGRFLTLIHPTAIVAKSARIDAGAVICPYAIVSDSARVGPFTLLNYHSSMAHDSVSGAYAVLSPYATLGGGATLADDVFLGLHASVAPQIRIGARSKISAQSCALHGVPDDTLLYGVPGKATSRLETSFDS